MFNELGDDEEREATSFALLRFTGLPLNPARFIRSSLQYEEISPDLHGGSGPGREDGCRNNASDSATPDTVPAQSPTGPSGNGTRRLVDYAVCITEDESKAARLGSWPRKGPQHHKIKWVKPADLRDYPMPPADIPLIPILRDWL